MKKAVTKKYVTREEKTSWRNTKSISKTSKKVTDNKELIKKAEKWDLPWYHVVKPKTWEKFLRSNPDKKKSNNLDPKRKVK